MSTALYSAMNISCPWRGLMIEPDAAINQREMQAAMYFYSEILWGEEDAPAAIAAQAWNWHLWQR